MNMVPHQRPGDSIRHCLNKRSAQNAQQPFLENNHPFASYERQHHEASGRNSMLGITPRAPLPKIQPSLSVDMIVHGEVVGGGHQSLEQSPPKPHQPQMVMSSSGAYSPPNHGGGANECYEVFSSAALSNFSAHAKWQHRQAHRQGHRQRVDQGSAQHHQVDSMAVLSPIKIVQPRAHDPLVAKTANSKGATDKHNKQ